MSKFIVEGDSYINKIIATDGKRKGEVVFEWFHGNGQDGYCTWHDRVLGGRDISASATLHDCHSFVPVHEERFIVVNTTFLESQERFAWVIVYSDLEDVMFHYLQERHVVDYCLDADDTFTVVTTRKTPDEFIKHHPCGRGTINRENVTYGFYSNKSLSEKTQKIPLSPQVFYSNIRPGLLTEVLGELPLDTEEINHILTMVS